MEKRKIQLGGEEKLFLRHYISKGSHSARSIRRAGMLLLLDEGGTVTNLVKRYAECKGLVKQVLEEKPRSGQPTIITAELEANITALACCGQGPEGRSSWTLDLMADKMVKDGLAVHLSYETVRKVLKKANSSPGLKSSGASLR